jgi:hypothetical protein
VSKGKAIGGYVRRKDRHAADYPLSYDKESHLGRIHHFVTPSGMIISWPEEPRQFQCMPIMHVEPFAVENNK